MHISAIDMHTERDTVDLRRSIGDTCIRTCSWYTNKQNNQTIQMLWWMGWWYEAPNQLPSQFQQPTEWQTKWKYIISLCCFRCSLFFRKVVYRFPAEIHKIVKSIFIAIRFSSDWIWMDGLNDLAMRFTVLHTSRFSRVEDFANLHFYFSNKQSI